MRDLGGASSPRPSGSLKQTQYHNINMTQFNKLYDIHYSPSSVLLLCLYIYTLYNPLAFFLHIPAYIIIIIYYIYI